MPLEDLEGIVMLFHALQFGLNLIKDVLAYQLFSYQGKAGPVLPFDRLF